MEIFLIVILSIVVFAVWQSSKNTLQQLRDEIEGLQRDVGFLQDKLTALLKPQPVNPASTPTPATTPSPARQPDIPQVPIPPPQPAAPAPPRPTAAYPAAPPSVAAFKQPAPVAPITPSEPARVTPPLTAIQSASPPLAARAVPAPPVIAPETTEPDANAVGSGGFFALEERLGANWLNKLGIAILVVGLAFFLAYKLQTWGPEGKVLCGFAVSFALLVGGVWLERKATYRIFARGGIGGGWALTFFTTYAMYHVSAAKVLQSLVLDLVLMLIVAAGTWINFLLWGRGMLCAS